MHLPPTTGYLVVHIKRLLSPHEHYQPFVTMNKLFLLYFLCMCFVLVIRPVNCNLIRSCSQTPYPEICNSVITTDQLDNIDKTQFGFRDFSLWATLNRAVWAHLLLTRIDVGSLDEPSKTAWADCVELSENTIIKLNRSLMSTHSTSFEDVQTWLSAAVANHQTCRNGFTEMNSSPNLVSPLFTSSHFSELLSNSLAINKAAASSFTSGGSRRRRLLSNGFPRWVSTVDQKLLGPSNIGWEADVVVAKDGSGHYKTIWEAVVASKKLMRHNKRFVIYVKAGVYHENIQIDSEMKNLMFIGDGIDSTIITSNTNVQGGLTTYRAATFVVIADGFIARDMTFQNTAGPQMHQAVALRSSSDHSIFYRCSFKGYQDTLYVHSQRQFYRDCDIYGTIDFIFGYAAAIFQNCNIYVRRPMIYQQNSVAAHGRSDPNENTGIVIHHSRIVAAPDLWPAQGSFKTFLGRPWMNYSRTVIMKTYIGSLIDPAGWVEWIGDFGLSTLYFGEYMNRGGGAHTGRRVKWPGYHILVTAAEARNFSARSFLHGDGWIPATGVPYISGL